jgi:hypothetical protein
LTEDHAPPNPYASPTTIEKSSFDAQPAAVDPRMVARALAVNYLLLIGSIAIAVAAVIYINSIAFAGIIMGPICVITMIVIDKKRLPRSLGLVPSILLIFIISVWIALGVFWPLTPQQAQIPVGRICIVMAATLQVCWVVVARERKKFLAVLAGDGVQQ